MNAFAIDAKMVLTRSASMGNRDQPRLSAILQQRGVGLLTDAGLCKRSRATSERCNPDVSRPWI
jgi:hypothetical protein